MQGALICQDWPGPRPNVPLDPSVVFSAADASGHLNIRGMMAVLWGSFTAGRNGTGDLSEGPVGDRNAVSHLAQQLLGAAPGGALAVLGFVDRMLGFSFPGGRPTEIHTAITPHHPGSDPWTAGRPCVAGFDETYGSAVALLNDALERGRNGQQVDTVEMSSLWTVTANPRNVVLIGDPAVRLPAAAIGTRQR